MKILKDFRVDKLEIKIMKTRPEMGAVAADLAARKTKYNITIVIEMDPSVSATDAEEMSILFGKMNYPNIKENV